MLKSLLQASSLCTAAMLFCLPAAAADLNFQDSAPVDVVATSGSSACDAYAGIQLGYADGDTTYVIPADYQQTVDLYLVEGKLDRLTGGLYGGCNFDSSSFLLGVEGDMNLVNTGNEDWYGTVRLRAGPSFGDTSLYATAGVAFGQLNAFVSENQNAIPYSSKAETPLSVGYAVGLGVEQRIAENVSWKLEYLYLDLGEISTMDFVGNPMSADWTAQSIRTGIAYHF